MEGELAGEMARDEPVPPPPVASGSISQQDGLSCGANGHRIAGPEMRRDNMIQTENRTEFGFKDIVGDSKALRRLLGDIETVAPADSTVLIHGETGTGKELIARAVHNLIPRYSNAFVKSNCAAIPTGFLESELFGHERGAFTGAITQRAGRFELAHRGTIFLDEIGDIPLELQPKLLRVIQEREFERLGSTRTIRSDARLVAATNCDLKEMVDHREVSIRSVLSPERFSHPRSATSRKGGRYSSAGAALRSATQRAQQPVIDTVLSETMEALTCYQWPGNIRELQNVIERAVIITKGATLRVKWRV